MSSLSPGVASDLIEVGCFLSNKTSPAKVTTLSSALAGNLSYKIVVSLLFLMKNTNFSP